MHILYSWKIAQKTKPHSTSTPIMKWCYYFYLVHVLLVVTLWTELQNGNDHFITGLPVPALMIYQCPSPVTVLVQHHHQKEGHRTGKCHFPLNPFGQILRTIFSCQTWKKYVSAQLCLERVIWTSWRRKQVAGLNAGWWVFIIIRLLLLVVLKILKDYIMW